MSNEKAIREFIKQNIDFCKDNNKSIKLFAHDGEVSSILYDNNSLATRQIEINIGRYLTPQMKISVIPIINREASNRVKGQKIFLSGLDNDQDNIISICIDELQKHPELESTLNNLQLNDMDVQNQHYKLNKVLGNLLQRMDNSPQDSQCDLNINENEDGSTSIEVIVNNKLISINNYADTKYDKDVIETFASVSETYNVFLKINDIPLTNNNFDNEQKKLLKYMKINDVLDQIKGEISLDRLPDNGVNYILKNGILEKTIPGNGLKINIESNSEKTGVEILNHLFKNSKKAVEYIESSFLKMDGVSSSSPLYQVKNCLFETHVAKQEGKFSIIEKEKTLPTSIRIDANNDKLLGGRYIVLWKNMVDEVMALSERENGTPINIGILTSSDDKKSAFYAHPLTDEKYFFINPNLVMIKNMGKELTSLVREHNLLSDELLNVLQSSFDNAYDDVWNQFNGDIDGHNITFSTSIENPILTFPKKHKTLELTE